ncbi:MAG: ribosome biogenesis GTPase YlqF [Clostridiales bacterium]|nr:ribosome biogenesis GTPase YlqF [Clostridiales bacterium]
MINWYPGHMTKAVRMIEENLRITDCIVYVLDARAPFSCINPDFERLIGSKPVIYAVNKADLGDAARVKQWVEYLAQGNRTAFTMRATASKSSQPILAAIKNLCRAKIEKYKAKGVRTTVKCMVLGVPNTGKSTVINNLCGSAKTVTGNRPGVTRGKQWVRVNDFLEVLDTPGTLYPKLNDQTVARRLAYIGSIKDEITDTYELACSLCEELLAIDSTLFATRYGAEATGGEEMLLAIAQKRGYVLRGGEVDTERAASALLDDFRRGRLGGITLDSVSEYAKESSCN